MQHIILYVKVNAPYKRGSKSDLVVESISRVKFVVLISARVQVGQLTIRLTLLCIITVYNVSNCCIPAAVNVQQSKS